MTTYPTEGIDLTQIQALSLDDLVGGAADTLPYAIYQAQLAVVSARQALADEEKHLADVKSTCLAALYARPEGAGKNAEERRGPKTALNQRASGRAWCRPCWNMPARCGCRWT